MDSADYFLRQDRARTAAVIRAKAESGERLTSDERAALMGELRRETYERICSEMAKCRSDSERGQPVAFTQGTADGIRKAIGLILGEVFLISATHAAKREALEDRVTALEAAQAPTERAKPRVRRAAPTRPHEP